METAQSFLGCEDLHLYDRLRLELPGIFQKALSGLTNLIESGRFVETRISRESVAHLEEIQSPVHAWMKNRTRLCNNGRCSKDALYRDFERWCLGSNLSPMSRDTFHKELRPLLLQRGLREIPKSRRKQTGLRRNSTTSPPAAWKRATTIKFIGG